MFASGREAKEYLVGRIVDEARREGVPLSEIETKMMYFSETASTLPDILEVNEEFDRDYNQAEYEEKIAGLIRGLRANARERDTTELANWNEAVRTLRNEDHYLLVMIDVAGGSIRPGWGQFAREVVAAPFEAFRGWLRTLSCSRIPFDGVSVSQKVVGDVPLSQSLDFVDNGRGRACA
jgi:hypothetical protein